MVKTTRCLPAVLAAAALMLAACGGDDPAEPAAGTGGAEPGAAADSGRAVKYSQCMRDNGVPEFPDPKNGRLTIQAGPGSSLDPESPQFKAAQEACRDLAPSGPKEGSKASKEMQESALAHARCMRENGVPDWPDPDFSGGGVRMRMPEGLDQSAVRAAQKACGNGLEGARSGR